MTRRRTLPGAEELFRTTGAAAAAAATAGRRAAAAEPVTLAPVADLAGPSRADQRGGLGRAAGGARRPTGRERHDEKITVYVSAEELLDLERARLTLRADHGLAVDRGRIVREALAVVLSDLDAHGRQSVLVRRLHGR